MTIRVATEADAQYADLLCQWYVESAKTRGTGIAKREPAYVAQKMASGDGIIAFVDGELAGFCYIETFDDKTFVVNSGLIVNAEIRKGGVGRAIKQAVFNLSRTKYPQAKIFGITTSLAVMKINTDLGYEPVTFSELTSSEDFWKGCKSCKNYGILMENERKMCLCTGMLFDATDKLVQVQVPDFAAVDAGAQLLTPDSASDSAS
ncbi:GNAT family N-acetyltransferase [Hymenobacter sp. BT770]|uniref:GNAT family N-acetyltransferase n=1 Tax=Hymenobacter sp. BT770 TaxID=2886942 RepID=UPI001D12A8F9|nr:GNAT family N-acetyltransferase [Hymenobacter sp. BT770]MCC3152006.1 GNAT family N-acetyltransferase [Hymenobacter sp. BT770]MDO3417116.1 GNAT family N-acetyltransferase [Hymenobacter sp. BT770]